MEEKPVEGTQDGAEKQPEASQPAPSGEPSGTPAASKVCSQCNTVNTPQSVYCYKCGLKLPDAEARKICKGCQTPNSPTSQYCYKCGLKLPEQAGGEFTDKYAGFWARLGACLIDIIIIGIVGSLLTRVIFSVMFGSSADFLEEVLKYYLNYDFGNPLVRSFLLFEGLAFLASTTVSAAYYTIATGKWGKTIGKAALGIKVINADGSRVSYWRAFGRYWARILNNATLGLAYIVIAFTNKKQGVHDFICNTIVIKTD
ncbi:MAG: RDD family protein [Dehalococcoidales bacterium]|nr:RDD family protein [Dehalococcoidales bacterium]